MEISPGQFPPNGGAGGERGAVGGGGVKKSKLL